MRVTVKLFATLSHYGTGARAGTPFAVELPENAVVKDLMNLLQIPAEETKVVFINNIIREPDATLSDGDMVGMFSPVGGG